jgi:hypothetical protein
MLQIIEDGLAGLALRSGYSAPDSPLSTPPNEQSPRLEDRSWDRRAPPRESRRSRENDENVRPGSSRERERRERSSRARGGASSSLELSHDGEYSSCPAPLRASGVLVLHNSYCALSVRARPLSGWQTPRSVASCQH